MVYYLFATEPHLGERRLCLTTITVWCQKGRPHKDHSIAHTVEFCRRGNIYRHSRFESHRNGYSRASFSRDSFVWGEREIVLPCRLHDYRCRGSRAVYRQKSSICASPLCFFPAAIEWH